MKRIQSSLSIPPLRLLVTPFLLVSCWAQQGTATGPPVDVGTILTKLAPLLPQGIPLDANQLGSLRQETFSVQDLLGTGKDRVVSVQFFEVFQASYRVVDGRIETETVSLDATLSWLVAFDEDNGQWYPLSGFERATAVANFNRLAQSLSLELHSTEQALELFDYYLKTVEGAEYRSSIPTDPLSLQAIVSQDYVERYPIGERGRKFQEWWSRSKTVHEKLAPPSVERVGELFQVSFFRYSQNRVSEERIFFSKGGRVVSPPK